MTSCCRCACLSMTRRIASDRLPLRSATIFRSSDSCICISSVSRCRTSILCCQADAAAPPPPPPLPLPPCWVLALLGVPPPSRCRIRSRKRSVADPRSATTATARDEATTGLLARFGPSAEAGLQLLFEDCAEGANDAGADADSPWCLWMVGAAGTSIIASCGQGTTGGRKERGVDGALDWLVRNCVGTSLMALPSSGERGGCRLGLHMLSPTKSSNPSGSPIPL